MVRVIYFDIETVSGCASYDQLSPALQLLWDKKSAPWCTDDVGAKDLYIQKAGIYAEFGKIICVSCGYFDE